MSLYESMTLFVGKNIHPFLSYPTYRHRLAGLPIWSRGWNRVRVSCLGGKVEFTTLMILALVASGGVLAAAKHGPGHGTFHQSWSSSGTPILHIKLAHPRTEKKTQGTHTHNNQTENKNGCSQNDTLIKMDFKKI